MRALLSFLLVLFACDMARAGDLQDLTVNGVARSYYLHVPAGLQAGAPMVLVLHGAADNGTNAVKSMGWEPLADAEHFVLLAPNATSLDPGQPASATNMQVWNSRAAYYPASIKAIDDVGFISTLIDKMIREQRVDPRRIYVAGFSNGGYLAESLGQLMPDRIAALAVAGSDMTPLAKPLKRPVSVLVASGGRDYFSPVRGGHVQLIWGNPSDRESPRQHVDRWRDLDSCPTASVSTIVDDIRDEISAPCRDGTEVRYLFMPNVDHRWPTGDPIDLTRWAWAFFKRFHLPATP